MNYRLESQRKKLLQRRVLQKNFINKQQEPVASESSDTEEGVPSTAVYWRSDQSGSYDPRLRWRLGPHGKYYYDSTEGTRSLGNLPSVFLDSNELNTVSSQIRNALGESVSPEVAGQIFSSALGETNSTTAIDYARRIAQNQGLSSFSNVLDQLTDKAKALRQDTLDSLRREGIYTTEYVNSVDGEESEDESEISQPEPEPSDFEMLADTTVFNNEELYNRLSDWGKSIVSKERDSMGVTIARIAYHQYDKGPDVVLKDVGDCKIPSSYRAYVGVGYQNTSMRVTMPSNMVGKPLKVGKRYPRGLVEASRMDVSDAYAERLRSANPPSGRINSGEDESFDDWVEREDKEFQAAYKRAIRKRTDKDTGRIKDHPRVANFKTGKYGDAVGILVNPNGDVSDWVRNNYERLLKQADGWRRYWSQGGIIYSEVSNAMNKLLNTWRQTNPTAYEKWGRGWIFAHNVLESTLSRIGGFRNISSTSAPTNLGTQHDQSIVSTDSRGNIAAALSFGENGREGIHGNSAGTHPMYIPEYPYQEILKGLEGQTRGSSGSTNQGKVARRALGLFKLLRPKTDKQSGISTATPHGAYVFGMLGHRVLDGGYEHLDTDPLTDEVRAYYQRAGLLHPQGYMQAHRLFLLKFMMRTFPEFVPIDYTSRNFSELLTKQSDVDFFKQLEEDIDQLDDEDYQYFHDPQAFMLMGLKPKKK